MNGYQRAERTDRAAIDAFAFGGKPVRPSVEIRLLAFRPLVKGSLRGFARVQVGHLIIDECPVLISANGKPWCALPAKPQINDAGQVVVDQRGKRQYTPILQWSSRQLSDDFSAAVVAAIRRLYPDTLDAEQPGLSL